MYRRQFILTNNEINDIPEDFISVKFGIVNIYYHSDLNFTILTDGDNRQWGLLGDAFCVDKVHVNPEDDIKCIHNSDVIQRTKFWTGRWALLNSSVCVSDATGLMGLYYYTKDDGQWFVSNGLHFIYSIDKDVFGKIDSKIYSHDVCRCFPPPNTRLNRVKKLFANQCIYYDERSITITYCQKIKINRDLNLKNRVDLLCEYLTNALINIKHYSGKKVELAFTAGYDSRVLFAAAIKSGIHFSTFTMQCIPMSSSDYKIPRRIASDFGIDYQFIRRGKKIRGRNDEYTKGCFYSIGEADRDFYVYSQYDSFAEDIVIVKGGLLDLCRVQDYKESSNIDDFVDYLVSETNDNCQTDRINSSFDIWKKWWKEHDDLRFTDDFYINCHIAGWLSDLQQSLDLIDIQSIQVANCSVILAMILGASYQDRNSKIIYEKMYETLCPSVANYPINPADKFYLFKYYLTKIIAEPKCVLGKLKNKVFHQ